jgi:16S rRNA (guanine527-N7)-methyltransferase
LFTCIVVPKLLFYVKIAKVPETGARVASSGNSAADITARIATGATALDIVISARQLGQLGQFVGLLERWNKVYNLTSVRDPREMVAMHILDSLTVLPFLADGPLLDLGTGGGLPGIVIGIMRPELDCLLIDSVSKKTRFCRQAITELGLSNVDVVHARIEELGRPGEFGTVTARAFAPLDKIVALGTSYLCANGRITAMKGRHPADELRDAELGDASVHCYPVAVPGAPGERHIVTIDGLVDRA